MNQDILDYINQCRNQGTTDEHIKHSLLTAGWSEQDIQAAMDLGSEVYSPPNKSEEDLKTFISKWSWGGFLLYSIYFIASRNYKKAFLYLLGNAVPLLNVYLWFNAGYSGRKLVWESNKWKDFESYRSRQKLLDKIAIIVCLVSALVYFIYYTLKGVS